MHHCLRLPFALTLMALLPILGCSGDRTAPTPLTNADRANASWLLPAHSRGEAPTAPVYAAFSPAASDLRVMSFNLRVQTVFDGLNHWNFRRDLLVQTIREFDPDLLGTQECLAKQADYLRKQLPDYRFVGVGRSDGKRRGEMCGIFFRSDKFELVDSGHFWLSNKPAKPGSKSWGSMFPRMATWVKLRPRSGGPSFCFFNTHFDNIGSRARLESAHLLREKVATIAQGRPTIVTGDFNTGEATAPYHALVSGSIGGPGFVDTFRIANPQVSQDTGTRHGFGGTRRGPRIDWILTTGGFQTLEATIDYTQRGIRYPSDHFPVTAVLRATPQARLAVIE